MKKLGHSNRRSKFLDDPAHQISGATNSACKEDWFSQTKIQGTSLYYARRKAARRCFYLPLLKQVREMETQVIQEVEQGFCGNHVGTKSLNENVKAMILLANHERRLPQIS